MRVTQRVTMSVVSLLGLAAPGAPAQASQDTDVRVAVLRHVARSFDGKARVFLSREALPARWDASSGMTSQPKGPPRDAAAVAAVARAIGAEVADAAQDFSCVAESPTCALPAPGTALVRMGTPEVTDSTATVVVSLRSVPVAATPGPRRVHGSVVWLRLVRRAGSWTVVEERPLSVG